MVDSPFHYFSRLAEDRININVNRATEINLGNIERARELLETESNNSTFNQEYTANFNASHIDWGSSWDPAVYTNNNFDWYGGCNRCYQFSMLFGSLSNNIGVITGDEDFEKYKMQFVEHYNEKHRNLYEWKKNKKGKKPITSKKNIERLQSRIPFNPSGFMTSGFDLTLTSNITFINVDESAYNSVFYSDGIPEITEGDQIVLDIVEERGEINSQDKKRIEKKYGKAVINNAMKKYRKSLLTRRLIRSGWRE